MKATRTSFAGVSSKRRVLEELRLTCYDAHQQTNDHCGQSAQETEVNVRQGIQGVCQGRPFTAKENRSTQQWR